MTPGSPRSLFHRRLRAAFHDIITGTGAKRSKHELILDGVSVVDSFTKELQKKGYTATTVAEVDVRPGERVPAFYIDDRIAYFGWVFWEKFTATKMRKLWGSVVRNKKGDWAIQISPMKKATIYANEQSKTEMDIDRPSDF